MRDIKTNEVETDNTEIELDDSIRLTIELINDTRSAQGYLPYTPDEILPIAVVWLNIFTAKKIPTAKYGELLRKAVNYREQEIRDKKRPTPFSIELLLAQYVVPSSEYGTGALPTEAEMVARGFPAMGKRPERPERVAKKD